MQVFEKVDVLAFAAHPDDVELSCSGTLAKYVANGKKVAVIDLTEGEMGTRGNIALRYQESAKASQILGIQFRENLKLPDCGLLNTREHQLKLIQTIRKYRPTVVLCNAPSDRHPDHGMAAQLEADACFYSGLIKIETTLNGNLQEAYRPPFIFHYIQDQWIQPDLVININDYFEQKLNSIKAYSSQFYNPRSTETETYISDEKYFDYIRARCVAMGHLIGVKYGEGFIKRKTIGMEDFNALL